MKIILSSKSFKMTEASEVLVTTKTTGTSEAAGNYKNNKARVSATLFLFFCISLLVSGCVERKLTINTQPQGALVVLNDEEIGTSPVTVEFNWYGDYKVRLSKPGYETLNTHRELERPMHDHIGIDFIAEAIWPGRIEDHYEWSFQLEPYVRPERDELIENAEDLKSRALAQ
jgi:hypothetical protein